MPARTVILVTSHAGLLSQKEKEEAIKEAREEAIEVRGFTSGRCIDVSLKIMNGRLSVCVCIRIASMYISGNAPSLFWPYTVYQRYHM